MFHSTNAYPIAFRAVSLPTNIPCCSLLSNLLCFVSVCRRNPSIERPMTVLIKFTVGGKFLVVPASFNKDPLLYF